MNCDNLRSLFPITKRCCFLNHAAVSPLPTRAVDAVKALVDQMSQEGIVRYNEWVQTIDHLRGLFARLVGARPQEIGLVTNTSEGINCVAQGLRWKSDQKVVLVVPDFPSNVYPWMNLEQKGVKVIFVKKGGSRFRVKDIEKAIEPGVRLISVSSVDFSTGFYCDLEALGEFCQRKGLLLCVDAIQSLGLIPMHVKKFGIHFLAAGGQKWLLGPMGCGGLYISEEINDQVNPAYVGWRSVAHEHDFFNLHFDLKSGAQRFETGTPNLMGIYALAASIELLLEIDIGTIRDKVFRLLDTFAYGLEQRNLEVVSPLGRGERSGILCFRPKGDPATLFNHFLKNNIIISERNGLIRISPHFYNNQDDVESFFSSLDSFK